MFVPDIMKPMTGSTSAEELSVFSDGEMKENFSFTHSPYGSESVEFEDERLTPTTPRSGNSGPKKNCNVYISNLPAGVDDVWLRKEFGRFGLITSAKVMHSAWVSRNLEKNHISVG